MNRSPLGSFVHGIFQARILEWVAISFSRDLPNPRIKPTSPALAGWQSDLWIFTDCYVSLFGTTKHPNWPENEGDIALLWEISVGRVIGMILGLIPVQTEESCTKQKEKPGSHAVTVTISANFKWKPWIVPQNCPELGHVVFNIVLYWLPGCNLSVERSGDLEWYDFLQPHTGILRGPWLQAVRVQYSQQVGEGVLPRGAIGEHITDYTLTGVTEDLLE